MRETNKEYSLYLFIKIDEETVHYYDMRVLNLKQQDEKILMSLNKIDEITSEFKTEKDLTEYLLKKSNAIIIENKVGKQIKAVPMIIRNNKNTNKIEFVKIAYKEDFEIMKNHIQAINNYEKGIEEIEIKNAVNINKRPCSFVEIDTTRSFNKIHNHIFESQNILLSKLFNESPIIKNHLSLFHNKEYIKLLLFKYSKLTEKKPFINIISAIKNNYEYGKTENYSDQFKELLFYTSNSYKEFREYMFIQKASTLKDGDLLSKIMHPKTFYSMQEIRKNSIDIKYTKEYLDYLKTNNKDMQNNIQIAESEIKQKK